VLAPARQLAHIPGQTDALVEHHPDVQSRWMIRRLVDGLANTACGIERGRRGRGRLNGDAPG
jgi:hypothetical protein